jgi:4-hydroxyproline epimerase
MELLKGQEDMQIARTEFTCLDGHTCGNPVRLVVEGRPELAGATMSDKRQDFLARLDWIRTSLMFEPRGHDMMSGGFLYPSCSPDADASILFIETSGCLPMCGHGTIGMVTFALENGLVTPKSPGRLRLDVPAGRIEVEYERRGDKVTAVRLFNIDSFLYARDIEIDCPELGRLTLDVSYGGNFYAILEPQAGYRGIDALGAAAILRLSPIIRALMREKIEPVHPDNPTIRGVSHVLWADAPRHPEADARNAVFYGDRAIDRSPCGTGTSARMAQLAARGKLAPGQSFTHESIIGSLFKGRVESSGRIGEFSSIRPSVQGWAVQTGINRVVVDPGPDPFWRGFQLV